MQERNEILQIAIELFVGPLNCPNKNIHRYNIGSSKHTAN